MNENNCPLCGNLTDLKTEEQKGYRAPDLFKIFHCPFCNTSFSFPYPSYMDDIYEDIYKYARNVLGYDRYYCYYDNIKNEKDPIAYLSNQEPSYWGLFSVIKKLKLSHDAFILEIGSGLGYTTYALQHAGFVNAKGLDISKEAVDNSVQRFGNYYVCADICDFSEKREGLYDVVFFTEVIEHITEPMPFIQQALHLLKKDGILIITTPNKSFYPDDAIWITENPPVHCWWFSEETFKFIAEQVNAKISFVDFSQYYKKHEKVFYNVKTQPKFNLNDPFFDSNGNMIKKDTTRIVKKNGIFPRFIKQTSFYKKMSRSLYPFIFKDFISSNKRTDILCAILQKK